MIKMIKQTDEDTFYWEIWEEEEDQELLEHFGIVGDQGESRRFALPTGEDAEVWMEEIAEERESEGYEYLDEEELHELVIQYSYEEDQIEEALERRHAMEELMNECLGWTGNGHCDGGDIGSGTTNIFTYVVHVERAVKSILEELQENDLIEGVKLAYGNRDNEEYEALYPKGAHFELI